MTFWNDESMSNRPFGKLNYQSSNCQRKLEYNLGKQSVSNSHLTESWGCEQTHTQTSVSNRISILALCKLDINTVLYISTVLLKNYEGELLIKGLILMNFSNCKISLPHKHVIPMYFIILSKLIYQYYVYQLMIYIASDSENLFNSFHVYQEVRFSCIWTSVCTSACICVVIDMCVYVT